jgi:hypothetical protein
MLKSNHHPYISCDSHHQYEASPPLPNPQWTCNRRPLQSAEPQRYTSGIDVIAPFRSAISQDRRIRLGYTVYLLTPTNQYRYLKDPGTGHRWWWQCEEAGVVEKEILEEYGNIVRWNGSLGVHFTWFRRNAFLTLIPFYSKSGCGLQTPKPSAIFSRLRAICMRNHPS